MGGLLVLFLAGLYLWVAYKVVRHVPKTWGKAVAVFVLVLIPTTDAVYGRIKLKQMCEAEGGLKIYKTVEGVEGVFSPRLAESLVVLHGYKFTELSKNGQLIRLSKDRDGKVTRASVNARSSVYEHDFSTRVINYMLVEHQNMVKDSRSGQVLGVFNDFHYYGGWVSQALDSLYSQKIRRAHCESANTDIGDVQIITSVLKVSK